MQASRALKKQFFEATIKTESADATVYKKKVIRGN